MTRQTTVAIVLLIMAGSSLTLRAMGRIPWCRLGDPALGSLDIRSPHNSQHVADPYTLTHVVHGFVFFGLFWLVARRSPLRERLVMTALLEASWEILENTEYIVSTYRTETLSLHYCGDSIINSSSDITACLCGFLLASRLNARTAVLVALTAEILLGMTIRDNLTLNVLMLVHPLPAVKSWQQGPGEVRALPPGR